MLNVLIARFCNLDSHVERKNTRFNCRNEPFLPLFQKGANHVNVFDANPNLWGNFAVSVAATAQGADVLQKVDCAMLPSSTVFNEAHDEAITFLRLNDNGWNFGLTKLGKCFNSALAANEIIACRIRVALSRANRDWTLEPDIGNALHDLLKISPVADPRVQKADLVNGNSRYPLCTFRFRLAHATSQNEVWAAIE